MAVCGKKNLNATQFSMTDLDYVDGKHTVCAEGFDSANVDDKGKPIRIKHTDILVDPFQLSYLISDTKEIYVDEDDWGPMDEGQLGLPEDDLPCAKIKPRNVLWVCNLSPVAEDEDLYTIFSRFGTVTSAGIIRDGETGDSHCYGFIEFQDNEACELAYVNMDNALIDDRRIHVGFSQSVANSWRR